MWGSVRGRSRGWKLGQRSAQLFLTLNLDPVDNRCGGLCATGHRVVAPPWRHALCAMAVPAMIEHGRDARAPAGKMRYVSRRACAATGPTAHAHGSAAVGTEGRSAQLFLILNLDSVDNRCGERARSAPG